VKPSEGGDEYDFVRAVVESCVPVALSPKEIEEASYNDEELSLVKNCVKSGNWQKCTIPSYAHVKDELYTYGEFLLRGTRRVVPKVLQDKVVRLAREGHQGVVKTKYRLRSKMWWPGMDKDVPCFTSKCSLARLRGRPARTPTHRRKWWWLFVYYSRFLEVAILKSTTSTKIIEAIGPMFVRFGVPFSLRTDNGPQFVSEEFKSFLQAHGVAHCRKTPLWPQANGEVARQNRSLLKSLQIATLDGKNWRTQLVTWLAAHRSTPQTTTGDTPFHLMFGREMRTKLPKLRRETVEVP